MFAGATEALPPDFLMPLITAACVATSCGVRTFPQYFEPLQLADHSEKPFRAVRLCD